MAFFSKSGAGGACPKRAQDCTFDVITSRPARQYQVIGVIDIDAFSARNLPNDEVSFRRAVAKQVCEAGGDAVIPGVNGDRRYVLATVVKWVEEERTTPICPKPPPDAGAGDGGRDGAGARDAGADAAQSMDAGHDASARHLLRAPRALIETQPLASSALQPTSFGHGGATC